MGRRRNTLAAACWQSGEIDVVAAKEVPQGTIVLAKGEQAHLEAAIQGSARLSYDGKTWLVPGVPEADDGDAALNAALLYRNRLGNSLRRVQQEAADA
ncbi:hypothetical protein [Falsiroseomonas sp.]|uniref:hypothetical protein n=1 Tax=Falsiroseomonas sp. TaxID=2870721 RepID=UPI003F6F60C4